MRLLLICFIVLVLSFWHFTDFQIKNQRARKWKCHMICIWKFCFSLRWFWSILRICQVNLLPWLSCKEFIDLVVSCRFWHILRSFAGFGGFRLPPYLSNLCNPLVMLLAINHFTMFAYALAVLLCVLVVWLISLWHAFLN
jgi:hypothetical protein